MDKPLQQIVLVTPVWNDTARLAVYGVDLAKALAAADLPVRWVIADDGSTQDLPGRLEAMREQFSTIFPTVELHYADAHRGKGAVIREAWSLAPEAGWLAFVDADGSVAAEEMMDLISRAVDAGKSVIAIRKRTTTTEVVESRFRGLAHRGFLMAARLLLRLHSEDIQCGAKVLRADAYRRVEPRLREDGLAFDSELLCSLARDGSDWLEIPVNWVEKPGGKVKPLRDGWRMLLALIRIRSRWHRS